MVFVLGRDGLAEDFGVDFEHVWAVAADGGDVAAFFAAFGRCEVFVREQRGSARRAEEDSVGFPNILFQQALVFAVFGADDTEGEFGDRLAEGFPVRGGVEVVHEGSGAGEGAVDDVDVVDVVAAEHEGEADVPFCLFAGAEDGDGVDVCAAVEYYGCGEGGAEGGELFGGEEGVGGAA